MKLCFWWVTACAFAACTALHRDVELDIDESDVAIEFIVHLLQEKEREDLGIACGWIGTVPSDGTALELIRLAVHRDESLDGVRVKALSIPISRHAGWTRIEVCMMDASGQCIDLVLRGDEEARDFLGRLSGRIKVSEDPLLSAEYIRQVGLIKGLCGKPK